MAERIVRANGIDLCAETFGAASDPAVLLVMGAGASKVFWETDFCEALVEAGRYVVCFDNRDTGRSTHFDFQDHPYTLADLAADAVGLLDVLGIESAHVVGASMGGMVAQLLALDHPRRVRTITALGSSADPSGTMKAIAGDGMAAEELPGPTRQVLETLAAIAEVDLSDRAAFVRSRVDLFRAVTSSTDPFDEAHVRELFAREVERAVDFTRSQNHSLAIAATPPWRSRLASIRAPTLVLHGAEDPLVPIPHGQAIASAVPQSQFVRLSGIGHYMSRTARLGLIPLIVRHTSES